MSSSSGQPFPRVTVLGHLRDYADTAGNGHVQLRSCWWQLTKSRTKGSKVMMSVDTSFRADSLRQEWRTRLRLVDNDTHQVAADLVEEQVEKKMLLQPD